MLQVEQTSPRSRGEQQGSSFVFVCVGVFFGILACGALLSGTFFALSSAFGNPLVKTAHVAPIPKHVQLSLNIVINQPGMQKDWPAYAPNKLVVPANSIVTVTLKDYDLGNTPLPNGSPYTRVQGVVGGKAYADGKAYNYLAPEKVAHTFTISQMNVNVPLPGDAPRGAQYDTITFTFHTGKAGTYAFQCFDPCGTGTNGWMGPMMMKGYMIGSLTVQ
ncbi:MAG TPA: hypothetical protein VFQ30_15090 [Ktedonobacteraceae bacterium]|nr:hypothetical protein [Ktedonobacteraceae bacterium]